MMEEPKQPNKEPELVSVEGLQFERYQMDWIEISAKLDGQTPTKFIHDLFLDVFSSHLDNLSGREIL
ncbi:MAG: hypothetical protein ACRD8W_03365, partial [Nitrososphaeraceae archaeon]